MTIICYRNGIMAADSRVTEGTGIFTDKFQKIFRLNNGALLGTAGDADDKSLIDFFNSKKKISTKAIASLEIKFEAILVKPSGEIFCYSCEKDNEPDRWVVSIIDYKDPYVAVGSGAAYAMGAMERGASAEQAVKTAIKFDSGCGGKVQSVHLKEQDGA